jgi:hypothetical protein
MTPMAVASALAAAQLPVRHGETIASTSSFPVPPLGFEPRLGGF